MSVIYFAPTSIQMNNFKKKQQSKATISSYKYKYNRTGISFSRNGLVDGGMVNLRVNCLLTDLIIKNTYIQTSYGLKNYSTFHLLLILKTFKKKKLSINEFG